MGTTQPDASQRRRRRLGIVALAASVALGGSGATGGELGIYEWPSYSVPELAPGYAEKYGAAPRFEKLEDEQAAFERVRDGLQVDLAHPCARSLFLWRDAGLLEPIDPSRIERWDELDARFRDLPGFLRDGQPYFVPFDWGATAIVHRTDLAPEPTVQTLKAFADPSFAGKIGIPDMIEEVYALGFLATGVTDWSAVTDEQFRAASDFLRAVHANRPWYWVAGDDLHGRMARGEIVLAWTWSEYLVAAQKLGAPVALKLDPEEGASAWGCGFVKLANGVADDAVIYDYINAALEPRVATALMDGWGYGHGNAVAMAEMDQDRLVTLGFLDPKEMRARMLAPLHRGGLEFIDPKRFRAPTLWQAPVPADLREKMVAEWARIKSGS